MLDRSSVLRIRGLRQSLNMPWKHKYVPPCGVFPLLCPDVNCHSEPQLQQSKPSCCGSLFMDTWKQSGYFPPQKELCGCLAHEKKNKTYGPCRFSVSFQNVRKRVTGLSDIIISSCSPCLDWVHTVYRNKWLWLLVMSRAKSPHLSWLTCSLLDMNWNGFIHGNHKKGRQNSSAMLSKECSLIVYYTSTVTWHP